MTAGFEGAAWSWVDHVRHGGSTPWLVWARGAAAPPGDAPAGATLPGAAELEFVRLLAARAPATLPPDAFIGLADLVLARSGPGRGLPQLPLLWPGAPVRRVGAPATDPAAVPAEELVRIGVGALLDLLLRPDPGAPRTRRRRRRPWTRPFRLAGAPLTVAAVRASLAAGGHVEGGRRPDVLLFAQPFDVHLAEIWSARVQRGAPVRWESFVDRWARRPRLPPAVRLRAVAGSWASRVGPDRVHVVVAPYDADAARRTAAEVLGLRDAGVAAPGRLRELSPAGTEVLRRLGSALNVRVAPARRTAVLRRAAAVLDGPAGPPLVVPGEHLAWAERTATRLGEGLRSGGYSVHGDLDGIAVRHHAGPGRPRQRDALDLVLGACLALVDPVRRREAG